MRHVFVGWHVGSAGCSIHKTIFHSKDGSIQCCFALLQVDGTSLDIVPHLLEVGDDDIDGYPLGVFPVESGLTRRYGNVRFCEWCYLAMYFW